MLAQWNNFFVMVGGGAAALAGLIFVAMSINHEIIIQNTTHKNRAINMLTGFSCNFYGKLSGAYRESISRSARL